MEFFDKLGKKASEAYKMTADKTGKIAKETKNKLKMSELKTQVSDLYEEIGKKVYEKHLIKEEISIKDELEEECAKIDALSAEIENLLKETLELKDKRKCENCHAEIEKDVKFCPKCGEKQEFEQAKEVEVIENEKAEDATSQEEKVTKHEETKQEVEENKKDSECQKNNLETTVEVETNPQIKEGENNQFIDEENN